MGGSRWVQDTPAACGNISHTTRHMCENKQCVWICVYIYPPAVRPKVLYIKYVLMCLA